MVSPKPGNEPWDNRYELLVLDGRHGFVLQNKSW